MAKKGDGVKLLGFWISPFSRRVEMALKLKGISYKYLEEDLPKRARFVWLGLGNVYMGIDTIPKEMFPELNRWIKKLNEIEIVKECIPSKEKHIELMNKIIERTKST